MKRALTSIAAASLALGMMVPAAFAATTSTTKAPTLVAAGGKTITLDGTTLYSGVQAGTAKDAGTTTSYFPIYYLIQSLTKAGYTNNYDASSKTWNIQMPGVDASKIAVAGGVGTGNAAIAINGVVVKKFNAQYHTDFAGGKNAVVTTYFPIYYLGNVLSAAGFSNAWTGTSFGFNSVYGAPSAVKLSSKSSTLVANGVDTTTVTASVVDANGHTVSNFSGTVNVAVTTNGAVKLVGPSTTTYANGQTTLANVKVTNGVATFDVIGSSTAGLSDTVSVNGLVSYGNAITGNIGYSTEAFSTAAPVATSLTVTPSLPGISSNNTTVNNVFTVNAQVEDQSGNDMASANYVTLTITGPGSFSATSDQKSLTIYTNAGSGSTGNINVYASQGQQGDIVVSATATGLTSGSATVPAYITTAPTSLQVTSTNATTAGGVAYTTYTVKLLDASGHLVTTGANAGDAISISDNTSDSTVGGTLNYYTATSTGAPNALGTPATLTNGVATFVVENSSVGTANPTITVTDNALTFKGTAPYTYQTGLPDKVEFEQTVNQTVQGSQAVTLSAQLEDAAGNALKTAGQNVVFYFNSNSVGATLPNGGSLTGAGNGYVVSTDSNGVATITVNVPAGATSGNSFQLYANLQNGTDAAAHGPVDSVVAAADYATGMAFGTWGGSSVTAYAGFPANGQLTAGTNNGSAIPVVLTNAIGAIASGSNDKLAVTTSNPSVLSFVGGYDSGSTDTKTVQASSGAANLEQIHGGIAGTATITVKDLTNPSVPSLTKTLTVVQSGVNGAVIEANGQPISSSNPLSVTADTPIAVTVYNVDSGNNPVPVTSAEAHGATAAVFSLADAANNGSFRLSPNGANVTSVSIPVGQSSTTVYYVNGTTKSITTAPTATSPLTAASVVLADSGLTAGTSGNLTVTLKDSSSATLTGFSGTLPITISGAVNSANGTAPVLATQATFVNGVATVPVTLYSTAAQNLTVTVDGLTSAADTPTVTAAAVASATLSYANATLTSGAANVTDAATVVAKDAYGNTVSSNTGTFAVTTAPTGAAATTNYTIDPAAGTFTVVGGAGVPGTYTVTYTNTADNTVTATFSITVQ